MPLGHLEGPPHAPRQLGRVHPEPDHAAGQLAEVVQRPARHVHAEGPERQGVEPVEQVQHRRALDPGGVQPVRDLEPERARVEPRREAGRERRRGHHVRPQPLEDPLRGVALLLWSTAVFRQDLVDNLDKRIELRTANRLLAPISGRDRKPQHLLDRAAVDPENTASLAPAHAFDENRSPDPSI